MINLIVDGPNLFNGLIEAFLLIIVVIITMAVLSGLLKRSQPKVSKILLISIGVILLVGLGVCGSLMF